MNIINIRIEMANPFDRWEYFRNLGCVSGLITQYKAWELEHSFYTGLAADFELKWSRRVDHAGVEFGIGLLGYGINFRVYDTRHWDDYHQQWEVYKFDEYFEINS
jgi:hypothetical protein